MTLYRFEKTVKVAGHLHTAGSVVAAEKIPVGHLSSMLRLGQIRELAPGAESAPPDPGAPASSEAGAQLAAILAERDALLRARDEHLEDQKLAEEEFARLSAANEQLTKENTELREQLAKSSASTPADEGESKSEGKKARK